MHILHIALGGCLTARPVRFGITEDTGGHIAYVLGAARAQEARPDVRTVEIVTRAFDDPRLGAIFAARHEIFGRKGRITRLAAGGSAYLEKDALAACLPDLTAAFLDRIETGPRPDVIHAHFADAARLAAAAWERFGIPWVYTAHSLGLDKAGEGPAHARRIEDERRAIAGAHAIIASSRDETERQLPAYAAGACGRVHCINPGVTLGEDTGTGRARRLAAPFLSDPGREIVLAVARPVEKKNLAGLLEAYAASPELCERANLVLLAGQRRSIGSDGSQMGRVTLDLFERIDRHGLWGRVALPRRHDAADLRAFYAWAAAEGVFVNPAFCEPFGLTVVEALQAGCPVVATRHGGPGDILAQTGGGETVDPADRNAIAAACLRALDARDPVVQARAATRARKRFDWGNWASRAMEVYRGCLASGTATRVRAADGSFANPAPIALRPPRRLLVSDIDGTLGGDLAAARALADRLAGAADLAFTVATGRSISEARRILAKWSIPAPRTIVASVGSEIWHAGPRGSYRLNLAFAESISEGWDRDAVDAVARDLGLAPQAPGAFRPWKASYHAPLEAAPRLSRALREAGLAARVVASHARFIDILPARAGKAAAMAWLAERMGLGLAECIAAGDSGNDRDMLEAAGAAIIPANALAELDDLSGAHVRRVSRPHAGGVLEGLLALGALGGAETDAGAMRRFAAE